MLESSSEDQGSGAQQSDEQSFSCRTESSKTITQVLQRLCHHTARKDQECQVEVTKDNISFLVTGKAKTAEGRACLDSVLFEDYFCSCDVLSFTVNLIALLDCLLLFGSTSDNTAAIFSYSVRLLLVFLAYVYMTYSLTMTLIAWGCDLSCVSGG